jgi:sodium-dependent dicarboxylate transporter 2/3/5
MEGKKYTASVFKSSALISPVIFLLLLAYEWITQGSCGMLTAIGIAIWVIAWWVQEPIPILYTSLIPSILMMACGILSWSEVYPLFYSPIIQLFLGGFLLGLALEKWKLHERFALFVLSKSGNKPNGIILGIMFSSYFMSMWISNTATAMMMLPMAMSMLTIITSMCDEETGKKITYAGLLGIAFGANIGGTATLIGTPPNLIFVGLLEKNNQAAPGFLEWMSFGIPFSLLLFVGCYLLFTRLIFRLPSTPIKGISTYLKKLKIQHGKMNIAEIRTTILFGGAVCCWILSDVLNPFIRYIVRHWNTWMGTMTNHSGYTIPEDLLKLSDAGVALFFAFLAFWVPSRSPVSGKILAIRDLPKISWPILMMFVGGMTVAKGLSETGFLQLISDVTDYFPPRLWMLPALLFIIVGVFLTELMSNLALATVLLPVVFAVSTSFGIDNPLVMGIPVTIACSLAFMMPISTPPNAVVYSSKRLPLSTMIRTGFWLNVISLCFLFILTLLLHQYVTTP